MRRIAQIVLFLFGLVLPPYMINAQNFISFGGSENSSLPTHMILNSNQSYLEAEYHFGGAFHQTKTVEYEEYSFLRIDGFSLMTEPGNPALPAHIDYVAVPDRASIEVEIIRADYIEVEGYYIHPALEPARDTEGAEEPPFIKNQATYSKNAFFPESLVEVIDIQTLKGVSLAMVQIRPVQFNPVKKMIRVYSSVVYRIKFTGGSWFEQAETNSIKTNQEIKSLVVNPEIIPSGITQPSTRSNRKDYIIITHSEFAAAADTLAAWKRQKGYSVEVISSSSWTSTQVKDSIHTRYNNWTPPPEFFVIIGDHSGTYPVPGEIKTNPSSYEFATDLYYACMDGTSDYYPDMSHGRISVTTASQALSVIQKIVNYERYPVNNASFYSNGLNCAQFQDDSPADNYADRRFCHTSEEIRDYTMSKGYSIQRIYYSSASNPTYYNNGYYSDGQLIPTELRDPGFDWGGTHTDITSAINSGKFYVFHRDHGYVGGSGWAHPYYTTSTIGNLSNGNLLPVVFSINCHTGEFKLSECFAEKFLRYENGGAVGLVAASNYSYSGYNDGFSVGMIDAIWSDPGLIPDFGSGGVSNPNPTPHGDMFAMGDVMNQGLFRMVETWGNNKYTFELFHYFGDPAQEIWTAEPVIITASVPNTAGEMSIVISESSCEDAVATACFNGMLIGKTVLSGGSGTINYPPRQDGDTIIITLSKHNYRPLIAKSRVTFSITDPPEAIFSGTPTTIMQGETVAFSDITLNAPTSWAWSFPGGTPDTSNDQNPIVQYNTAGTFDVYLVAHNSNGNDDTLRQNYITVSPLPLPVADFSANPTIVNIGSSVTFTDQSTNNPNSWQWVFEGGNPSTSIDQNPVVTYDTLGTYNVTLITTNLTGSDTITKTDHILVDLNYCSSQSSSSSYEWISQVDIGNFSYGSGSANYSDFTGQVITLRDDTTYSATFIPGYSSTTYPEYWRVWIDFNRNGDFSDSGEEVFAVNNLANAVTGNIIIPSFVACTTRMRVSMKWNGIPSPCETFSFGEVEDYSVYINGIKPPVADFSVSSTTIYEGDTLQFTDLSKNSPTSYLWTFEGGTPASSSDPNPECCFETPGEYYVQLYVSNAAGSDTKHKTAYIFVHPRNVVLSNDTINTGNNNCFDAIDTLIIAGDGNPYIVSPGANLSVVAGDEIRLKPGFIASESSYFHALIDENGCTAILNPEPIVLDRFEDNSQSDSDELVAMQETLFNDQVSLYPNPTTGNLTIELPVIPDDGVFYIEIYDFLGKPVFDTRVMSNNKLDVDLSAFPDGLYIVRVSDKSSVSTKKIIKQ